MLRPKSDRRTIPQPANPEPVDPIWLLKGVGIVLIAALICAYLALCVLFYQGQWQLVLHPTRSSSRPASIAGIRYEVVRFGPDESAVPQLIGWWIPATPAPRYPHATILFLPGGDGALTDYVPVLESLHAVGADIFAFDYRGYGQSAAIRPNQRTMMQDADSAWRYILDSRSNGPNRIVPYGLGIGSSLATHLALTHPAIRAVILDSANGDLLDEARRDPRSRLLPVDLLFHDRFPLIQPLSILHTPKLLLSRTSSGEKAFRNAASPKLTLALSATSQAIYRQTVAHFLDQYLPSPIASRAPSL